MNYDELGDIFDSANTNSIAPNKNTMPPVMPKVPTTPVMPAAPTESLQLGKFREINYNKFCTLTYNTLKEYHTQYPHTSNPKIINAHKEIQRLIKLIKTTDKQVNYSKNGGKKSRRKRRRHGKKSRRTNK